uniref:Uncharacterized protein n=1 Tax=Panagrolaimus sp. ES5 TaxID=591445 RepID=A0AC34FUW8_9BILA
MILLLPFCLFYGIVADLSCKNHNDQNVNWFIIYKLPKENNLAAYFYADEINPQFELFDDITAPNTPIQNTFVQRDSITFTDGIPAAIIEYNDQIYSEKAPHRAFAHAKGMVHYFHTSGYYVTHSFPKYVRNFQQVPTNALIQAQHMVCLTIDEANLAKIVHHLYIFHPQISTILVEVLDERIPELDQINRGTFDNTFEMEDTVLNIEGNFQVRMFSKSLLNANDLWDIMVGKYASNDVYMVQSNWNVNSQIGSQFINDILTIELSIGNVNRQWTHNNDHSKIALTSKDANNKVLCFSDVNHDVSH